MPITALQSTPPRPRSNAPARAAAAKPQPLDSVKLSAPIETPEQAVLLPAVNAMLLNAITFDVAIAAMGEASLSMPMHLAVGDHQGDITYSLPLGTNVMKGEGSMDGKPFREQWTFGKKLEIAGSIGDIPQHLTVTFDDKSWNVSGHVGATKVDEKLQFSSSWQKSITDVQGTVGASAVKQTVENGYASADGKSDASMHGDLQGAPCTAEAHFQTLKDRIVMQASGQSGAVAWSASSQAIYTPSQPPDQGANR